MSQYPADPAKYAGSPPQYNNPAYGNQAGYYQQPPQQEHQYTGAPQQQHYQQPQQQQYPPLQPDHQLQYQSPQPISPQPVAHSQSYTSAQPTPQPHPEMAKGQVNTHHSGPQKWEHGFCSCFGDMGKCCLTCWCPCITYGKIQHRLRHNDMSGFSSCNGHCWGFCGLGICGLQWVMSMMQRGEIRHQYNLEGSGCGDCMRHFCCECCALIQEDRETETRKSLLVPAHTAGYQQQPGMTYPH
ncbi:hypothetical protein TWF696_005767 [Orbilia brochopaga]|uniref:PLAC8-domain-containing protein n=1 Tax=Orbilia brochopaga TaxID=3140254 RepID=A0AAV9UVH7_9PEZI